jgi:ABC-type Fe3+/spermidine/putrescine transport system ATPase subunit
VAVTHDQVEALTMADVVAVMCDGHIEQVGSPDEVYLRPATIFVATFLGEANLLPVEAGELAGFGRLAQPKSGKAVIRPEQVAIHGDGTGGDAELRAAATIEDVSFQGARLRLRARLNSAREIELTLAEPPAAAGEAPQVGETVDLVLDARGIHVIPDAGDAIASEVPEVRLGG